MTNPSADRPGADSPRDHRSPWGPRRALHARPLQEDVTVDACVVGAGMAGLLCALELAERGRSVMVLERERLAAGDTSATTAHLTAVLDSRYFELARMHGADAARLVASSHTRGVAHLERVMNAYEIDCGFERVDGFLCAGTDKQAKDLEREHTAATSLGLHCELLRRAPLPLTEGPALRFPGQAQFDPLAFLSGVVSVLERKGVPIHAPVTVTGFEPSKTGAEVTLTTDEGRRVRASHVIVATHTPVSDMTAIHTKQVAYRTYAMAVETKETNSALAWDMEDPYHYVRFGLDAATQRRVLIVGGQDHRTGQDSASEQNFPRLEAWLRQRFPNTGKVVCQWSGQVFEPSDGLAFIGKDPAQPGVFILTGFSGNGMTYSGLAAELIADLTQGLSHPFAAVYDPKRKPASATAIASYVSENLNTAAQYADWLAPADVTKLEQIPRGEGAVMRRGVRRVAVYVDEMGAPHELSATCPHLRGVVSWNSAEKTWDCPCHGSRFDCLGKVITGPALTNLEPLQKNERDAQ